MLVLMSCSHDTERCPAATIITFLTSNFIMGNSKSDSGGEGAMNTGGGGSTPATGASAGAGVPSVGGGGPVPKKAE